jgi:hypothetical protein
MSQPAILAIERSPRAERLWAVARTGAMAATLALLVGLFLFPEPSLRILWHVLIPVLPATFFVQPALWRGICPLATIQEWGRSFGKQRMLSARASWILSVGGLVSFHLLVPARRFLFNRNGPVLASTVIAIAVLALVLGAVLARRSAFCNALCPVLPVELLYGQAPLLPMARGRCATCSVCTPRGCLDLAQGRALAQATGTNQPSRRWVAAPYAVFFAALPGFILGYGVLEDVDTLSGAARVYAATLGLSAASYAGVAALVLALRLSFRSVGPALATISGVLYYVFAGPTMEAELGLPPPSGVVVQVLGIGCVHLWWWGSTSGRRAGSTETGSGRPGPRT